mmetsp:Transcript_159582/g.488339  ORF Transcript_159582/g.488339 Transcript_159582/m.488339 type:complete len:361 (+) Transcript_159582:21-1103(+)
MRVCVHAGTPRWEPSRHQRLARLAAGRGAGPAGELVQGALHPSPHVLGQRHGLGPEVRVLPREGPRGVLCTGVEESGLGRDAGWRAAQSRGLWPTVCSARDDPAPHLHVVAYAELDAAGPERKQGLPLLVEVALGEDDQVPPGGDVGVHPRQRLGHPLLVHAKLPPCLRGEGHRHVANGVGQAAQDGKPQVGARHERLHVADQVAGQVGAYDGRVQPRHVVDGHEDLSPVPARFLEALQPLILDADPEAKAERDPPEQRRQPADEAAPAPHRLVRRPYAATAKVRDQGVQPHRESGLHESHEEEDARRPVYHMPQPSEPRASARVAREPLPRGLEGPILRLLPARAHQRRRQGSVFNGSA